MDAALYQGTASERCLGTADAVHQAGLSSVAALRGGRPRPERPFYWAGFVAAGDWR